MRKPKPHAKGRKHAAPKPKPTVRASDLTGRFRTTPLVIRLDEGDNGPEIPTRIQLFRTGTFRKLMPDGTSIKFSITKEHLQEMVENWRNKVRGVDIALDFAHKSDEEAAGWFKNLVLEECGGEFELWAEIDWTPDGQAAVGGKKFRYVSPDFAFAWTDNETGKKYGATLFGAGLTNRPVIKNMAPTVELTEVRKMDEKELEALKLELAEQKKTITALNLKLEEASEDDESDEGDDGDEDDGGTSSDDQDDKAAPSKKPKKKEMNMEELKAAYDKVCAEMADMKRSMAKSLAETAKKEKEAKFTLLLAEGKVVAAQKEAFMSDDMVKFSELAQPVKLDTFGDHGKAVNGKQSKKTASDEVLELAEKAVKEGRATLDTKISFVLSENPELRTRYEKEVNVGE